MVAQVLVINPNSSEWMTAAIDATVAPLRSGNVRIDCVSIPEAPAAISGYGDHARITPALLRLMTDGAYDAYVIACFGDPGLAACREMPGRRVFGIGACSYLSAVAIGDRFGVLSTSGKAAARHTRYIREIGLLPRLVADLSIDIPAEALNTDPDLTLAGMIRTGKTLRDAGADVIVTGCAGMSRFRTEVEDALELPVVDPVLAGAGMAVSFVSRAGP